jgi:hypothetical protein
MEKGLKQCMTCSEVKALADFGKRRGTCNLCRTAQAVKRNDGSRRRADRIGQPWTDAEDTYIKDNHTNVTDIAMARQMRRTLKAVGRRRLFVLNINKQAKPEPRVVYSRFAQHRENGIMTITVGVVGDSITVFCNTNTLWANIWKAFKEKGLTDDDYKAWKVGVTN